MSPYGTKTTVRVDSELSEEFEVKVVMQKGSVLLPFLFAFVVNVISELARDGVLSELLYTDNLVLMSEIIKKFRNKFIKWEDSFESKVLKANIGKTKVIASDGITNERLFKSNVDPCGVSTLRVKANSVLCVKCGKWIHSRCAKVKRVTAKFSSTFASRKCEGNDGDSGAGENTK